MPELRVLGVDPSTTATGYALLIANGPLQTVEATGVKRPPGSSFDEMLLAGHNWLRALVEVTGPDALSIETPFYKLNALTLFKLASLGAVYRLAATQARIRILEVPPARRCTAVGLAGNATKAQVLYTVNAIYGLQLRDHNEADAVAIAAAGALLLREQELTTEGGR